MCLRCVVVKTNKMQLTIINESHVDNNVKNPLNLLIKSFVYS